jgi:hypothetical protein
MTRAYITILLLLLGSGSLAQTQNPPLCVLLPDAMPESWRPSDGVQKALSSTDPWSASEAKDALSAKKAGLDEMLGLFSRKPSAVPALWEDAVGALIEVTYSSANEPAIDAAARKGAIRNLTMLIEPYLQSAAQNL